MVMNNSVQPTELAWERYLGYNVTAPMLNLKVLAGLSLMTMITSSQAVLYFEVESNNTFPPNFLTGNPLIQSGDQVFGSITSGDVDMHYLRYAGTNVPGIWRYRFDMLANSQDTFLQILDHTGSGNIIAENDDYPNRIGESVSHFDYFDPNGQPVVFGFKLRHYTATGIIPNYFLTLTRTRITPYELGTLAPGHTQRLEPNPLGGFTNWYRFTLDKESDVVIDTIGVSSGIDTELILMDANGTMLAGNDDIDITFSIFTSKIEKHLPAGVYYAASGRFNMAYNWNLNTNQAGPWDRTGMAAIGDVQTNNIQMVMNFRVTPTEVVPSSFEVMKGELFEGDLSSVANSDDIRMTLFNDPVDLEACVDYFGVGPIGTPSTLRLKVETSVARPGLGQSISMLNFDNLQWTLVSGAVASLDDTTYEAELTTTANAHTGDTGEVKTRIRWTPINDEDPSQDGWLHSVDYVHWVQVR